MSLRLKDSGRANVTAARHFICFFGEWSASEKVLTTLNSLIENWSAELLKKFLTSKAGLLASLV